jgi:hypothetical protein
MTDLTANQVERVREFYLGYLDDWLKPGVHQAARRDSAQSVADILNETAEPAVETPDESVSLDYKLPCEVRVPPATTFGRGVALRSLMNGLRAREGKQDPNVTKFQDDRAEKTSALHDQRQGIQFMGECPSCRAFNPLLAAKCQVCPELRPADTRGDQP